MHVCSVVAGNTASCFPDALQAVGDGDQDVVDAARLQVVEDLQPELRALGVLDPDAEDLARAVGQHTEREIDGLVAHDGILADLDPQRVEEHHRVHRLERAALPGAHLGHHRVGDRTDCAFQRSRTLISA